MRRNAGTSGFTIMEVLVTASVVLVAMSGLMALQLWTTKSNVDLMNRYRAMAYAEELMEEIKATEWRDPCTDSAGPTGCDGSTANKSLPRVGTIQGQACVTPYNAGTTGSRLINTSSAGDCTFTGSLAAFPCDTLGIRYGGGYEDQVLPNTSQACASGDPPSGYTDNLRQNCDTRPPNPTGITFWRCVEMVDIQNGGTGEWDKRRVSVNVYWDDMISTTRGTPHRVTLDSIIERQP